MIPLPGRHRQQISLQEYPNRGFLRNLGVSDREELALANPSCLFRAHLERRKMGQGEGRRNEVGLDHLQVTEGVEA